MSASAQNPSTEEKAKAPAIMTSQPSSSMTTPWPGRPDSVPRIVIEASILLAAYFLIRFYAWPTILFHKATICTFLESSIVAPLAWTRDLLTLWTWNEERFVYIGCLQTEWSNPVHSRLGKQGYRVQSEILGLGDNSKFAFFGRDPAGHASEGGMFMVVLCYSAIALIFSSFMMGGRKMTKPGENYWGILGVIMFMWLVLSSLFGIAMLAVVTEARKKRELLAMGAVAPMKPVMEITSDGSVQPEGVPLWVNILDRVVTAFA